jgi:RimJ/RimL family protein N-acetyltransferase
VGFKLIGRQREARIIAGKKYDLILMDILSGEFESPYIKPMLAR